MRRRQEYLLSAGFPFAYFERFLFPWPLLGVIYSAFSEEDSTTGTNSVWPGYLIPFLALQKERQRILWKWTPHPQSYFRAFETAGRP